MTIPYYPSLEANGKRSVPTVSPCSGMVFGNDHGIPASTQSPGARPVLLARKSVVEKLRPPLFTLKKIVVLLALLYAVGAILSAWTIIARTRASTTAIEQILTTYNLKNE